MSSIKPTILFAFFCIALVVDSIAAVKRPCTIDFDCSTLENVVWATDGYSCFVLRNECQLKNENCKRENYDRDSIFSQILKVVPKNECQQLCNGPCPAAYEPVCAEYNGTMQTFHTSCALDRHMCRTGKPYSLPVKGECTVDI